MARLIDADKLYEELEEIRMDYIDEDSMSSKFAADVIETVQDEYLRKSPTVDAVEVVRCGKCVFRKCTENAYKVFGWNCTNKLSPCRGRIVGDSDFCPYGEREDNV